MDKLDQLSTLDLAARKVEAEGAATRAISSQTAAQIRKMNLKTKIMRIKASMLGADVGDDERASLQAEIDDLGRQRDEAER